MSKTLAELRQSPRVGLPERSYSLCLASTLIGEVQTLISELQDAEVEDAARAEGEAVAKPKRAAEKSAAAPIRKRLGELRSEMAEHTGILTLRGLTEGKWREWVDNHPPREGNKRDAQIAYNCCDADALLDDLELFAHAWNGDPVGPGDWDFIVSNAAPGDIKTITQLVVVMHETAVDIPKLLSGSLGILDAATA